MMTKDRVADQIALVFNNAAEYTTGNYFRDVFTRQGVPFRIFSPRDQELIPEECRLRFYIDDGSHYAIRPVPDVLKVLYLIDTHTSFAEDQIMARLADVVFCAQKNAADALALRHPAVHWLPLGCDPAVHHRQVPEKLYDVAFVGGVADPRRAAILDALRERYPRSFIGRASRNQIGEIYSAARIVVNCAVNNDLNMRFFEGLCSGAMLMTDVIDNEGFELLLVQASEPVCVIYRDLGSLLQKIDYYLEHETEREHIARAGQAFARLQRYEDRWTTIKEYLDSLQPRTLGLTDFLFCRVSLLVIGLVKSLEKRFVYGK